MSRLQQIIGLQWLSPEFVFYYRDNEFHYWGVAGHKVDQIVPRLDP